MRCERAQDQLPAYQDASLGWLARRRVKAHLEGCAACRQELRALERAVSLVRGLGPQRPPRDITGAVMARIAAEPQVVRPTRRPRPLVLVPAALAAVIALAVQVSVRVPVSRTAAVPVPNPAYIDAHVDLCASQAVGTSGGAFLLASELAEDLR